MTQYGYLPSTKNGKSYLLTEDGVKDAIKKMQRFGGLNETGIIDAETLQLMNSPRCGVPDVGEGYEKLVLEEDGGDTEEEEEEERDGYYPSRRKRYALQGSRWKKRVLSYTVGKYPTSLAKLEVDADVRKAFNMWAAASGLTFVRAENRTEAGVDIEIRFEDAEHGDEDSFDGPGGKDESISFISDSIIQYSIQF